MLHPSYTDLMKVVNSEVEEGEQPVVNSRYSIVLATSKRARQIIGGEKALVQAEGGKALSAAIAELHDGKVKIIGDDEITEENMKMNMEIADVQECVTEELQGTEEAVE